jgi:hypothetical protein
MWRSLCVPLYHNIVIWLLIAQYLYCSLSDRGEKAMAQAYSNPEREGDAYSLPDIEIFYMDSDNRMQDEEGAPYPNGYYWWPCFPGCLPDSEPIGPFKTYKQALASAQDID